MPALKDAHTLATQLPGTLSVVRPNIVGPLAVFPIITDRETTLDFVAFADGLQHGVTVKELDGGADVNRLVVVNPTDKPVLLYEGEEVLGAQQNRTFDISALVPARSTLQVPVTCVEAGRWDGARHGESFAPAPQAAYPELRRRKNARVREQLAAAAAPCADQGEVWAEVAAKSARHGVASGTGAMHDVFERHRTLLDRVGEQVPMHCSQVGMLAAIGGRFVVLDHVGNIEAFAALQPRLVQGYALDAAEADAPASPPSLDDARDFVGLLLSASPARRPARGLGEHLAFAFGGLAGTGLAHEGELVALAAFAEPGDGSPSAPAPSGTIHRPSRRRRPSV